MEQLQKVILGPHFRKLDEIFEPGDLRRLYEIADVVWGKDEPMPADELARAKGEVFAVITTRWRHGSLDGILVRDIWQLSSV
jgi:hypothetical protein